MIHGPAAAHAPPTHAAITHDALARDDDEQGHAADAGHASPPVSVARAVWPCPGITILAGNLVDCVRRTGEASDSLVRALLANALPGEIAIKAAEVSKLASAAETLARTIARSASEIGRRQPLRGLRS